MIRPANGGDLANIAALQITSWRTAYKGMLPDTYLGQPVHNDLTKRWSDYEIPSTDVLLVHEADGAIDGFINVLCDARPYVDNLHVSPNRRGSGIGAALMATAAQRLIGMGHSSLWLTLIPDNQAAVRFYKQIGGVVGPEQKDLLYRQDITSMPMTWNDLAALAACDSA